MTTRSLQRNSQKRYVIAATLLVFGASVLLGSYLYSLNESWEEMQQKGRNKGLAEAISVRSAKRTTTAPGVEALYRLTLLERCDADDEKCPSVVWPAEQDEPWILSDDGAGYYRKVQEALRSVRTTAATPPPALSRNDAACDKKTLFRRVEELQIPWSVESYDLQAPPAPDEPSAQAPPEELLLSATYRKGTEDPEFFDHASALLLAVRRNLDRMGLLAEPGEIDAGDWNIGGFDRPVLARIYLLSDNGTLVSARLNNTSSLDLEREERRKECCDVFAAYRRTSPSFLSDPFYFEFEFDQSNEAGYGGLYLDNGKFGVVSTIKRPVSITIQGADESVRAVLAADMFFPNLFRDNELVTIEGPFSWKTVRKEGRAIPAICDPQIDEDQPVQRCTNPDVEALVAMQVTADKWYVTSFSLQDPPKPWVLFCAGIALLVAATMVAFVAVRRAVRAEGERDAILEATRVPLIVVDPDNDDECVYASPSAQRLLGFREGMKFGELLDPEPLNLEHYKKSQQSEWRRAYGVSLKPVEEGGEKPFVLVRSVEVKTPIKAWSAEPGNRLAILFVLDARRDLAVRDAIARRQGHADEGTVRFSNLRLRFAGPTSKNRCGVEFSGRIMASSFMCELQEEAYRTLMRAAIAGFDPGQAEEHQKRGGDLNQDAHRARSGLGAAILHDIVEKQVDRIVLCEIDRESVSVAMEPHTAGGILTELAGALDQVVDDRTLDP